MSKYCSILLDSGFTRGRANILWFLIPSCSYSLIIRFIVCVTLIELLIIFFLFTFLLAVCCLHGSLLMNYNIIIQIRIELTPSILHNIIRKAFRRCKNPLELMWESILDLGKIEYSYLILKVTLSGHVIMFTQYWVYWVVDIEYSCWSTQ